VIDMKKTWVSVLMFAGIVAFCGNRTIAQENKDHTHKGHEHDGHNHAKGAHEHATGGQGAEQPSPEEMQAMMAEWMRVSTPAEHHKHLDYFVGKWKTNTKTYMGGPEAPPMESEGTSEVKWVLDGRFTLHEHKSTFMGKPYEGIGLTGYDNYRNMYIGTWVSNMGTNLLTMTGMRDPKSGVFTSYGEMDEPGIKVTGQTVKYVTRILDEDKCVFEIIDLHAGDDYKVIEITYTRQK